MLSENFDKLHYYIATEIDIRPIATLLIHSNLYFEDLNKMKFAM